MTDEAKRPRGRPKFEPTAEQRQNVENLAALGVPHDCIVEFVRDADGRPVSLPTLTKHFKTELKMGRVKANLKIAQRLYAKADAGDAASIFFWMKTRAGWRETNRVEVTGVDGKPVQTEAQVIFYLPKNGHES